jgi:hypothetical protein
MRPTVTFAQAGGTHFDTGFTAIQTLFTGTIAKVASLVAIVIGGYAFAHGEPGAKKATLFTDDSTKLRPQLSAEISKSSTLEVSQTPSMSLGIGMG